MSDPPKILYITNIFYPHSGQRVIAFVILYRCIVRNLCRLNKRMSAKLHGLSRKANWKPLCESMPARIKGKWYDRSAYCYDKVSRDTYGI